MSNNNNVSDGPIPFFSTESNQSSFLSGTNIVDNTAVQTQSQGQTQNNQPAQPAQPIQSAQPVKTVQPNQPQDKTKQSVQDVSSLFGNNNDDSFLSSIGASGTTETNNNTMATTNIPQNQSNLYYNPAKNGSTASLRSLTNQPYNYIQNSDSNLHASSSYTNLNSYNQPNNTTTGYMNIPNKSPYITSPDPNSVNYSNPGTASSSYNQGFYANPATQNSSSNLSNYAKNFATTGSNSSLNSFKTPNYSTSNYGNYQSTYPSYTNTPNTTNTINTTNTNTTTNTTTTTNSTTNNNTYISTTSNNTTAPYTNAPTTTGYPNTQTGTAVANSTVTSTTTVPSTTTATTTTGYSTTQNSTSAPTAATGYGTSQVTSNIYSGSGYSTPIPTSANFPTAQSSATNTYSMPTGYQNTPKNNLASTGTTYSPMMTPKYNSYSRSAASSTNNLLNTSASYSSLTNLSSTYKTNTANTAVNDVNSLGFSSYKNGSSPQLNYYNGNDYQKPIAPPVRSSTPQPAATSVNNLQVETTSASANQTNTSMNPYSATSQDSSMANSFVNSSTSLNDLAQADTTTNTTGNAVGSTAPGTVTSNTNNTAANTTATTTTNAPGTAGYSSFYYQNKNAQGFYSNAATSNSSPCLNSLNSSYTNLDSERKNSYDVSNMTGKHQKSNSVLSPNSTYQNSIYSTNTNTNASANGNLNANANTNATTVNNNGSIADNASYNGSVASKNEAPVSSLYYHEDNNGKYRSPTAPPASDNTSKLSPSSTNNNLNRPPSVPPNYGSYNYGTAGTATSGWNSTTTSTLNYASYTTPTNTGYSGTATTYPTSTTPTPYQPDTSAYRPSSTTPSPYQTDTSNIYRPSSTTPNPYQPSTTPNPNPYQPSTTPNPNPYQPDTTQYYGSTNDISSTNNQNFYNFDNQSQSEIHSCDPIVIHKNLSPVVTFGFGGKLVVMFPKDLSGYAGNTIGANTVHVKPVSNFIYPHIVEANKEHDGPILGLKKNKKQIIEMITKKINKVKNKENHYNSYSSIDTTDTDEVLILKIIKLYIENDGVVYGPNSKPEAIQSLRNLLLANYTAPMNVKHSVINGPSVNTSEIENIKECLLQGDRPGACKIAVNNKLWGHALIIASYINKETYKDVVNSFIKSELQSENDGQRGTFQSIKVLYSLFAGMGKDSITGGSSPSSTTPNPNSIPPMMNSLSPQPIAAVPTTPIQPNNNIADIVSRWKEILGMILSNRTPNDVSAIVSLGDTLLNSGQFYAAHLCYLFSPSSISGLNGKNTKAVLLGTNHYKHKRFFQDLSSFQMTEFLEYMYYLANKNLSTMPHFQAYKLAYASWLSEIGLVNKAFSYTQCVMQIVKAGTNNNSNGTTTSSLYYNPTFFEVLREFSSRCQGHLSGTKNAPKDGWFSKITKFETFMEAFDHGLNKFIGTTENEKIPNLTNTTSSSNTTSQPPSTNPVPMMPSNTLNNTTGTNNLGMKNSSSYQSLNQAYYGTSYSNENLTNVNGSRKNSFSKNEQKGVFSLIGNLFTKNPNSSTSNNSSNASLNQDDMNKNGYYDSITKQWVSTNPQSNDKFGNDITAPPPVASDGYYNSGYNTTGMMSHSSTSGTLSNGVIPQFNTMGNTNNMTNPRRSNRSKYNDPTLNMAYSNTTTQATNNPAIPPPLYSNNTTSNDNQNNTTYNYGWNGYSN